MAEGARLESVCVSKAHRGFESLSLRSQFWQPRQIFYSSKRHRYNNMATDGVPRCVRAGTAAR